MPKRKVFQVSFYVDLHAVTCPGVWLCPKGKVSVEVSLFGVSEATKLCAASFPLLFHERFHFQKLFKKADCLPMLEARLARLPICLQLLQYPERTSAVVRLAVFKAWLGDLLFPPAGGDIKLMFSTTESFPGIIAPVAEISTKLGIQECEMEDVAAHPQPLTICSKAINYKKRGFLRQRQLPVCHSTLSLHCCCFTDGGNGKKKNGKPSVKRKKNGERVKKNSLQFPNGSHFKKLDSSFDASESDYIRKKMYDNCRNRGRIEYIKDKYQEEESTVDEYNKNVYPKCYFGDDKSESGYVKYQNISDYKKQKSIPYFDKYDEGDFNSSTDKNYDDFRSDYENDYSKVKPDERYDKGIKELKRELRSLLDEDEEDGEERHSGRQVMSKGRWTCCPRCTEERYSHRLTKDGNDYVCRLPSPVGLTESVANCFRRATSVAEDEGIGSPVEEDTKKRPEFYASLRSAYENLYNKKKHKTPVWR